MVYIGIAGTGAFTSDPPPDHIPWLNIATVIAIAAMLEWLIFWGWRAMNRVVDAAEAK
jgi:hypothetical protein